MSKMIALVDCNSFFVSCEKVFNPAIKHKPVIVLSNNDGCVISRSQEAKDIGIPMGAPYFKCEPLIKKHDVKFFSSNFVLYGDMSGRVMSSLSAFTPNMEIYSIDEAFLSLEGLAVGGHLSYARKIRATIKTQTGIPVSVGVAPTKTLAKVANHIAKDNPKMAGVFVFADEADIDMWLEKTSVQEIWGIGREKALFLNRHGIINALQLKKASDEWIKKHLTVISLRTVRELRGIPSIALEDESIHKKAIITSRTFGYDMNDITALEEAVSAYVANAAEKMRQQASVAGYIQVFVETNRFKQGPFYSNSAGIDISPPSAYTPQLMKIAKKLLYKIYKDGYAYKRCGVMLTNFSDETRSQDDLFKPIYAKSREERLMKAMDAYNSSSDDADLFFASEGLGKPWYMKQAHKSKRFTTRWDELLEVRI